jgi:hypothetical protein
MSGARSTVLELAVNALFFIILISLSTVTLGFWIGAAVASGEAATGFTAAASILSALTVLVGLFRQFVVDVLSTLVGSDLLDRLDVVDPASGSEVADAAGAGDPTERAVDERDREPETDFE